jgi:nucleoid-associated protein Lsr2
MGMAKTMNVVVTDDIDGSDGAVPVAFGYQNVFYEIDLNPQNKARFAETLAPFISVARRVSRGGAPRRPRTAADRLDRAAIRAWAHEQGLTISDRGRLSAEIVSKYRAAH